MMKRVAFQTLGCKLNFAETCTIGRQFIERGFAIVEPNQPTDVFILNTCSVTERADRECRHLVRRALRRSPNAYVIVVGCYAQLQPEKIACIDGVDLVVGSKEKFRIFDYAADFSKSSLTQVFVSCIDEATEFNPSFSADVGGRTRAFLKIQDGCDYPCTFCTIPLARGASRSQPTDRIVEQAQLIASEGYKEIVLTGVNVGDYGRKIGTNLFTLMRQLEKVDGIDRIRVSSVEPNLLSKEMIDFVLGSEKFCNHFHIPLQCGSDTLLKRMRRRYLTSHYQSLIEYIKTKDPDAGIGADVIVGFPGETDELFQESYQFIADLPVSYLHVFTYSERPDTLAAGFTGSVEPRIRAERSEMLRMLGQKKRRAFCSSFEGKTLDVLFEANVRNGWIYGFANNYVRVETLQDAALVNQIRAVRITQLDNDVCVGTVESIFPTSGDRLEITSCSRVTSY